MASFSLSKDGFLSAELKLGGMARRALHNEPAMEGMLHIQEEQEVIDFAQLHGQFIRTGRTMESLTQPYGNDAIRQAHQSEATFGTRVPYAVYLRKHKQSGVLVTARRSRHRMAKKLLDFIGHGRV